MQESLRLQTSSCRSESLMETKALLPLITFLKWLEGLSLNLSLTDRETILSSSHSSPPLTPGGSETWMLTSSELMSFLTRISSSEQLKGTQSIKLLHGVTRFKWAFLFPFLLKLLPICLQGQPRGFSLGLISRKTRIITLVSSGLRLSSRTSLSGMELFTSLTSHSW